MACLLRNARYTCTCEGRSCGSARRRGVEKKRGRSPNHRVGRDMLPHVAFSVVTEAISCRRAFARRHSYNRRPLSLQIYPSERATRKREKAYLHGGRPGVPRAVEGYHGRLRLELRLEVCGYTGLVQRCGRYVAYSTESARVPVCTSSTWSLSWSSWSTSSSPWSSWWL